MTKFSVWAPDARRVDLQLNNPSGADSDKRTLSMHPAENGYWKLEVPEAGPGSDYAYLVDGEGPYPDPCSPYQPFGVHGPSRVVDHKAFPWTDGRFQPPPLASAVIYELHIGTFTPEGTFDSAILKLDHLVDLGVTHIEIMPVNEFSGDYGWGYDGVDLFAPHHAYGGPEGLKRLVDAAHARGLAVVLDVVYNHLGPSGAYLDKFGPYHSDRYMTNWGAAMNFDGAGSDEVRKFFLDNAKMWLRDYHIDGLRLDAVHAIVDASAYHFLEELAGQVAQLENEVGRHLFVTAESDLNDPRLVRSDEIGGYGLDAQWSDDFHHALHTLLTGEATGYYASYNGWEDLAKSLTQVFVYNGNFSPLRGRRHGRPVGDLPGYRFISFIQNHDQVGNRAQGDRLGQQVGAKLVKIAAAMLLTSPFVPLLFMGEEWCASTPFQYFTNHPEPDLGKAVSEGRRSEFGAFGWEPEQVPDPQEPATFERSRLDWGELDQGDHAEILAWYRQLILLRRTHPALNSGRLDLVTVTVNRDMGWVMMNRESLVVVCNVFDRPIQIEYGITGTEPVLLASDPSARLSPGIVDLPPRSVMVFELE